MLCFVTPFLTHSDRWWCHPCPSSRATPAHSYSAAGRWPDGARLGRSQRICRLEAASCVRAVDRWLLVSSEDPTSCCSHHRGNHAQESGQSVPNAGLPCTLATRPKQSKSRLTRRQGRDSRCSQQCVGDSPVQRRNGTLGTTQLGAGGAGLGGKYAGQDSVTSTRGTTPSDPPPARAAAEQ